MMEKLTEHQKAYLQRLIEEERKELAEKAELIASFKKYAFEIGIQLTEENFRYFQTIGIVACYPNILGLLRPDIIKDKEGLLRFDSLLHIFERNKFMTGFLYGDKFAIMAHPYFRRSFYPNNNFAPRFIEFFWSLNKSDIDLYIAIDFDRVGINLDELGSLELDTWFGPNFNRNITDIEDGIGKLRPPLDINEHYISFFFSDVYALDIKWQTKDGAIRVFYAEEFKTEKVRIKKDGNEYFPARYIHAEFDLKENTFRHFDGAIHFYTPDEYYRRRDVDFNYNAKNPHHIKTLSEKVFKMNGKIPIDMWVEFTGQFFSGNPLVIEYFEGKYPQHVIEMLEAVRNK